MRHLQKLAAAQRLVLGARSPVEEIARFRQGYATCAQVRTNFVLNVGLYRLLSGGSSVPILLPWSGHEGRPTPSLPRSRRRTWSTRCAWRSPWRRVGNPTQPPSKSPWQPASRCSSLLPGARPSADAVQPPLQLLLVHHLAALHLPSITSLTTHRPTTTTTSTASTTSTEAFCSPRTTSSFNRGSLEAIQPLIMTCDNLSIHIFTSMTFGVNPFVIFSGWKIGEGRRIQACKKCAALRQAVIDVQIKCCC